MCRIIGGTCIRVRTLAALTMESVLLVKTALRGYHVYQAVWEPRIGESFLALYEGSNVHDSNAMAVYRVSPRRPWRDSGAFTAGDFEDLPLLHVRIVSDLLPLGARVCAN